MAKSKIIAIPAVRQRRRKAVLTSEFEQAMDKGMALSVPIVSTEPHAQMRNRLCTNFRRYAERRQMTLRSTHQGDMLIFWAEPTT